MCKFFNWISNLVKMIYFVFQWKKRRTPLCASKKKIWGMDMRERDKVRWTTSERAVKRSEAERRTERSSARATAAKRWTKPHGAFTHTIIILFISEVFICLPYVSPSESESNQKISVNDTDSFSELVWSDFGSFHNKSQFWNTIKRFLNNHRSNHGSRDKVIIFYISLFSHEPSSPS